VLCEELGFIGGAIVLALFAAYAWRGLRAAFRAPDDFGRSWPSGITVIGRGRRRLINLGVVLGMMPTKGIPLPFISYGGSSLFRHASGDRRAPEHQPSRGLAPMTSMRLMMMTIDIRVGLAFAEAAEQGNLKLLIAGAARAATFFRRWLSRNEWLSRDASRQALFVGTERGMEMRLVPQAGLPLETIRSAGLKGMGPVRLARNVLRLGPAFLIRPRS